MIDLDNKLQDNWRDKYIDSRNYLMILFTEKEIIEKMVVIGNCHCCKKHSINESEYYKYVENCLCKCRHYRRLLYRCLNPYVRIPNQRYQYPVIDECESDEEDNDSCVDSDRYDQLYKEETDDSNESEH
jgi:hypothetical protein